LRFGERRRAATAIRYDSGMTVPRFLCILAGRHRLVGLMLRLSNGSVRTVVRCATCGAGY